MFRKITLAAAVAAALFAANLQAETLDTRIGKLEFTHAFANGYPTDATVKKLFNELDFQRAVQAYIWSIPLVSMAQWQYSHEHELGAGNGQAVYLESYKDRLGGLTYNATTFMFNNSNQIAGFSKNSNRTNRWYIKEHDFIWFTREIVV